MAEGRAHTAKAGALDAPFPSEGYEDFQAKTPRLKLIAGYTAFLMLALGLLEPALALAAFAWVMWATLPWAFEERIAFLPLRKKAEERAFKYPKERMITPLDVETGRRWLAESQDSFLRAGIVFLMSGFLDAASGSSIPAPFTTLPSTLDDLSLLILLLAFFSIAVGVYRGQQAIKFITTPSRVDEIAKFGSFYAVSLTKHAMASFVIGLGGMDVLLGYLLFHVWYTPLSYIVGALMGLDASFVLGAIGLAFVILERPSGRRRIVGPILVILPWVYLMALLVAERLPLL